MSSKAKKEWIGSFVLLLLIGFVGTSMFGYETVKAAMNDAYVPLSHKEPLSEEALKQGKPISALLITKNEEHTSFVHMTINKKDADVHMTNIPAASILKDNAQSTEQLLQNAEQTLGIPIDYYAMIDQTSIKTIVDKLDGIVINNPTAFTNDERTFPAGEVKLTGEEALAYLQPVHEQDVLSAHERQILVAKAIIKQVATVPSFTKAKPILNELSNTVQTNLTFEDLSLMRKQYKAAFASIKKAEYPQTEVEVQQLTSKLQLS
ncbi:LCP family protein [Priestia flexa]|nr:LCP family protein [Priestia flexa]